MDILYRYTHWQTPIAYSIFTGFTGSFCLDLGNSNKNAYVIKVCWYTAKCVQYYKIFSSISLSVCTRYHFNDLVIQQQKKKRVNSVYIPDQDLRVFLIHLTQRVSSSHVQLHDVCINGPIIYSHIFFYLYS